jgi:hypothetical protein
LPPRSPARRREAQRRAELADDPGATAQLPFECVATLRCVTAAAKRGATVLLDGDSERFVGKQVRFYLVEHSTLLVRMGGSWSIGFSIVIDCGRRPRNRLTLSA